MGNVLTNLHCLQRMRTPFELQNAFSIAILGLLKFFREDAAVTAQTMQIGNRPCRIYGEAHAEYLLLQMTGEHELQSMDGEVAAIAQSAHHFLFAAIPVESWNDALSPWEAPAVWGRSRSFPHWSSGFISRKTSKSFWAATRWQGCLLCGPPPRQISSTVSPLPRPRCGFRAG